MQHLNSALYTRTEWRVSPFYSCMYTETQKKAKRFSLNKLKEVLRYIKYYVVYTLCGSLLRKP